jgi:hypothetical protein
MTRTADQLRAIQNFDQLIPFLEEDLEWPFPHGRAQYDFEDLTFQYSAEEVGLESEYAAKIKSIHQLRPLVSGQPWGVFFVEFENKKLPIVVLRRILSHLVLKKRKSANPAERARWNAGDLIFISAFAEEGTLKREIAFAHFHQDPGDQPTLRVLGWDGGDTPLKLEHVAQILKQRLSWPNDTNNHELWRKQWAGAFRYRIGQQIQTADMLAGELARVARNIRDAAMALMRVESTRGPLRKMHEAFRAALIHDLDQESFADTYAQTITYGLLTAAISRTDRSAGADGTFVLAEDIHNMVPITNPFLKEMLESFLKVAGRDTGRNVGLDFDELGVQDVVELLRSSDVNLPAVLEDFGNRNPGEDPVIRFYEDFLKAYNQELKIKRGVFYTPQPVVSYIVRSVHELLRTEFGIEDGLASTVTWGEMAAKHAELAIPTGSKVTDPFVVILDPATGTATFLVEVIDLIYKTLDSKWRQQRLSREQREAAWNEYVPKHLLPRLHGYELLMAPYAIAHMKIGLKLHETGYAFASEERVRIYLTNALEPASDEKKQREFEEWAPALAHEAKAVNSVKRLQRFTVIIGNPPYSGEGMNKGDWIRGLIDTYMYVDGSHLGEKGKKNWLQDDYVKFLRYAQFELDRTKLGILGFINNHSFLDNPTFRGMRASLLGSFRRIHVLDLHGSSKKKERCPDGTSDENVFDIQQGVSVGFFWAAPADETNRAVAHADLWGFRGDSSNSSPRGKYNWLAQHSNSTTDWVKLSPNSPFYLFVPQDADLRREYDNYWKLPDVMPHYGAGIITSRDHFVTDFEDAPLLKRLELFHDGSVSDEWIRINLEVKDNSMWSMAEARKAFRKHPIRKELLVDILYRPFDSRRIYFETNVVFNMRVQVMRHMLAGNNVGLLTARSNKSPTPDHFFCSKLIVETKCGESTTQSSFFPLFLYPEQRGLGFKQGLQVNLSQAFLTAAESLVKSGKKGTKDGGAESIFRYAYAVFHSQGYRIRYAEFLKIDFPRLPLTGDPELFSILARLGDELVALHLLESPKLDKPVSTYIGPKNPEVEKSSYARNTVWIDRAQSCGFREVPDAVWNFHIGGYQVCEKWLKDRKGHTLSKDDIAHYNKIVIALSETIRLMKRIDEVIDEHGGWPDAFASSGE